jgi:hypothetical protein
MEAVKRIEILYGGELYTVSGRKPDELMDEIADAAANGPRWLPVNSGQGTVRESFLLITPGVPLAIVPTPDDHSTD